MNNRKIGLIIFVLFILLFSLGLIISVRFDKKERVKLEEKILNLISSSKKVIVLRNYDNYYKCDQDNKMYEITNKEDVDYLVDYISDGIFRKKKYNVGNIRTASDYSFLLSYKLEFYDESNTLIFDYDTTKYGSLNNLYFKEDKDKNYKGKIESYWIYEEVEKLKLIQDNLVSKDTCSEKAINEIKKTILDS